MAVTIRQLRHGCKIEDSDSGVALRLDSAGHWGSFRTGNHFYRRCMDGRIVLGASAQRLDEQHTQQVYQQAHLYLKSLKCSHPLISKSAHYDLTHFKRLRVQYARAYTEPVVILPPDRYGDVVVQPALGCPNRKCTFCVFYKDKPYSALTKDQLEKHLMNLKTLFREELYARQGVFLGSANAMALSQRRLTGCLELIQESIGQRKRGIATFADPDFSAPRTTSDWQTLRQLGLHHLVIGLETGWELLRAKLGKSGDLSKVMAMIAATREAGISVGLTLLTGASDRVDAHNNLAQTTRFLEQQALTEGDIIYISPLNQQGRVSERALQEAELFLDHLQSRVAAKVVRYQMQRSYYYA